ncbi:MAG: hypothetical protein WAX89_00030, partial [Alphaproteobacteria bacterium]
MTNPHAKVTAFLTRHLAERVADVKRPFPHAVVLGETAQNILPIEKIHISEAPPPPNSCPLLLSNLSLMTE